MIIIIMIEMIYGYAFLWEFYYHYPTKTRDSHRAPVLLHPGFLDGVWRRKNYLTTCNKI